MAVLLKGILEASKIEEARNIFSIHLVFLLPALVLMTGCSKYIEDPDPSLSKYCGQYELVSVHWEGTAKDLNADGTGTNSLLGEYRQILGYWQPDMVATVETSLSADSYEKDKPGLAFNVMLPYPEYSPSQTGYAVRGIGCLKESILLKSDILETPWHHVLHPYGPGNTDPFLSGIEEMAISDLSEDEFTVRLRCWLYDPGDGTEEVDYMQFEFRKI